jgi:hypothetical protein
MALSPSRARAQVVSPRTTQRKLKPKPRTGFQLDLDKVFGVVKAYAKPVAIVCVLIFFFIAYKLFINSRLFEVKQVEVAEASPALRADIETVIRHTIGKTRLMEVDIEAVRQRLVTLQKVREAWVARVMPDKLQVRIVERQPAVLVRRSSGNLVWLDVDAIELGDFFDAKTAASTKQDDINQAPPTATGFNEGPNLSSSAIADNRERIAIYKKVEQELNAKNSLWHLVDELDLLNPNYVKVNLVTSTVIAASPVNVPVKVILGNEDFRSRFETVLQILQAIKDQDTQALSRFRIQDAERLIEHANDIISIDASKPERFVFTLPSSKAAKDIDAGTSKSAATKAQKKPELAVEKKPVTTTQKKPEPVKDSAKSRKTAAPAGNRPTQATFKPAPGKKK